MNARPLPMTSAPIADVASLECEIPYIAAIEAGRRIAHSLQLEVEDIPLDEQGIHLHLARLATTARLGYDIETCGSGMDCPQAIRASLYPAIARLCQADYAQTLPCTRMAVKDYLKLPGVETAFPELVPLIARQPERTLATVTFQSLLANRTLCVPLALVNPAFLQDLEQGDAPKDIADDFDYSLLRRYSSSQGLAAGATPDEALLQGLLSAQEWVSASRFAVQGVTLRQRAWLQRVDEESLPTQIQSLVDMATQRLHQPIHLFDVAGPTAVPTYLACALGDTPATRVVSVGAGSTAEHAATRAVRRLLEMQAFMAWKQENTGGQADGTSRPIRKDHRPFPFQQLAEIIEQESHDTVSFHTRTVALPPTLRGRIEHLCGSFAESGLTPWQARLQMAGDRQEIACVQVLLAPLDADGLALQGLPMTSSFAVRDEAANQG